MATFRCGKIIDSRLNQSVRHAVCQAIGGNFDLPVSPGSPGGIAFTQCRNVLVRFNTISIHSANLEFSRAYIAEAVMVVPGGTCGEHYTASSQHRCLQFLRSISVYPETVHS